MTQTVSKHDEALSIINHFGQPTSPKPRNKVATRHFYKQWYLFTVKFFKKNIDWQYLGAYCIIIFFALFLLFVITGANTIGSLIIAALTTVLGSLFLLLFVYIEEVLTTKNHTA